MDSKYSIEDYRKFMVSRWIHSKAEGFRCPTPSKFENLRKYYEQLIGGFFPRSKDTTILEIGCGFGSLIYSLRQLGYTNIDAVDVVPECCRFVQQQFAVKAVCKDVFDFFESNTKQYQVILAFDVIEHFRKPEIISLLLHIVDALAENGMFIMRVPNGASPGGLYVRYSGFTHEVAFTPLSVDELFKCVGFKEVRSITEPRPTSNLVRSIVKALGKRIVANFFSIDPRLMDLIESTNIICIGIK